MRWSHALAYFFGGAFLTNAIPHAVAGMTGHPFPSPFATPPGEGMSPPWVNVAWGAANLVVAYLLLVRVGRFDARRWFHIVPAFVGGVLMAIQLAVHFGRVYGAA